MQRQTWKCLQLRRCQAHRSWESVWVQKSAVLSFKRHQKGKEQRNLPAFLQTNVTFYLICHEAFKNVCGPSARMKEACEVQVPPQAAGSTWGCTLKLEGRTSWEPREPHRASQRTESLPLMKCMEEATGRAGRAEDGNLLRQQGSCSGSRSGSQEVRLLHGCRCHGNKIKQLICWNVTVFTHNCT